jgi:hypothetical protein
MCETASVVAAPAPAKTVVAKAKTASGTAGLALPKMRLYFQVNEKGWGSHHSPILEAAHLKTTNLVRLVVPDGNPSKGVKYEGSLPTWFTNAQEEYEAQVKKLVTKVNKLLPIAQKRALTAHSVYNKELATISKNKKMTPAQRKTAINAADKKLATALKGAFATIHKIPGFVA